MDMPCLGLLATSLPDAKRQWGCSTLLNLDGLKPRQGSTAPRDRRSRSPTTTPGCTPRPNTRQSAQTTAADVPKSAEQLGTCRKAPLTCRYTNLGRDRVPNRNGRRGTGIPAGHRHLLPQCTRCTQKPGRCSQRAHMRLRTHARRTRTRVCLNVFFWVQRVHPLPIPPLIWGNACTHFPITLGTDHLAPRSKTRSDLGKRVYPQNGYTHALRPWAVEVRDVGDTRERVRELVPFGGDLARDARQLNL